MEKQSAASSLAEQDPRAASTDAAQADAMPPRVPRRMRRSLLQRVLESVMSTFLGLGVLLGLLMAALLAGPMRLPAVMEPWVSDQIADSFPNTRTELGFIELRLDGSWYPRLVLGDLRVTTDDGRQLFDLAEAGASFSLSALMQGAIKPRDVWMNGAIGVARRDAQGRIELSVGAQSDVLENASSFVEILDRWETLLESPELSELRQVELQGLTLRYEDARSNWAGSLDGGWFRLTRNAEAWDLRAGGSLLSGGDLASVVSAQYTSDFGSYEADFAFQVQDVAARDIAAQSAALEWFEVLQAPISGQFSGAIDAKGALMPVRAILEIGRGAVQPDPSARPIAFDHGALDMTFDLALGSLTIDLVEVDSRILKASGSAVSKLDLDFDTASLRSVVGHLALTDITVDARRVHDEELNVSALETDFRLTLDPFSVEFIGSSLSAGETTINARAEITGLSTGWEVSGHAALDQISVENLLPLWPQALAKKPRIWVEENLRSGQIMDADYALYLAPGQELQSQLDFSFADTELRYIKQMPDAIKARGVASFNNFRFAVTALEGVIDAGELGQVSIAGTSFVIPNTRIKPNTPAQTNVVASGPAPALMWVLNQKPLAILEKTPFDPDFMSGQATATAQISFPMGKKIPYEQLAFDFTAQVDHARSTVLVPNRTVSADQIFVSGDQGGVTVRGAGNLNGAPGDVVWRQPLGPNAPTSSRLTGVAELSAEAVADLGIAIPAGLLTGLGQADITLDLRAGEPPELSVRSNLQGVGMSLPPLGWRKPPNSSGRMEIDVRLSPVPEVTRLEVDAAGLSASGKVLMRDALTLDRIVVERLSIGSWLDGTGEVVVNPDTRRMDVNVTGGRVEIAQLDPVPWPQSGSASGFEIAGAGVLAVRLEELEVTSLMKLQNFSGRFDMRSGLVGPFSGSLNGASDVDGDVINGRYGLDIVARIARSGVLLRSLGILERAIGGSAEVALQSLSGGAGFSGELRIRETTVRDAPNLAALLNAVSVVGLVTQLAQQGLYFSDITADFKLGSDGRVTLYKATAVGPSVGITADGTADLTDETIDMRGVMSPIYLLNGVGSALSGQGEGVFGFNYTLKGSLNNPNIAVNPLSALTPSFLRNIFRDKPAPELPDDFQRQLKPVERKEPVFQSGDN